MFHIAANGSESTGLIEMLKVNLVEAKGIIGIPEENRLVSEVMFGEEMMEFNHHISGLPFLSEDDDHLILRDSGLNNMIQEERGKGIGKVMEFILFPMVTAQGMEMADPLTPAMEYEVTSSGRFLALEMRVTDKEEMGSETFMGEGIGKIGNPDSESSCLRINIRSFK